MKALRLNSNYRTDHYLNLAFFLFFHALFFFNDFLLNKHRSNEQPAEYLRAFKMIR